MHAADTVSTISCRSTGAFGRVRTQCTKGSIKTIEAAFASKMALGHGLLGINQWSDKPSTGMVNPNQRANQ